MPKTNDEKKKLVKDLEKKQEVYKLYESDEVLTWCHGCGNYMIQNALKRALTLENYKPDEILYCFDIGCHGNGSDKIGGYTFHGLHGRVISAAAGASLANPDLKVIASAGDGGTMSEGINHLVHSVRSNYPMLFVLHNNHNYALTTGQASATTPKGYPMNGKPDGVLIEPMNPTRFVLGLEPTFVGRSFSGDIKNMTKVFRAALKHKGFAFVEILQVCTKYNDATPQDWYWERVKYVDDLKKYNASDLKKAKEITEDFEKEIYLGVLYQNKKQKNFYEVQPNRKDIKTTPVEEVKHHSITKLLKEFK
jgi:2-oxoglutarate ferredoxin oxidoreductase subunit beta